MLDFQITILVIDDARCVQKLVTSFLNKFGYQNIRTAYNGKDALQKLKEEVGGINLIISDINMPIMNGLVLLKEVKKHEDYRRIPFIFLTAESEDKIKSIGIEYGAHYFLRKPFSAEALGRIIYKALKEKGPSLAS